MSCYPSGVLRMKLDLKCWYQLQKKTKERLPFSFYKTVQSTVLKQFMNRDISVNVVTMLRTGRPDFDSQCCSIFVFSTSFWRALGPIQPPTKWVMGSFARKQSGRSLKIITNLSSAEVKYALRHISDPPIPEKFYVFLKQCIQCLIRRNNTGSPNFAKEFNLKNHLSYISCQSLLIFYYLSPYHRFVPITASF